MTYITTSILADRRYSEFVYQTTDKTETRVRLPEGRGAPKKTRVDDGKIWKLVEIRKYAPVQAPRAAKAPAPVKVEPIRTTTTGPEGKTELVYSGGTVVVPTGGRPKLRLENEETLVEIRTVLPAKEIGKKGRAPIPTEVVEVPSNPRTVYVYGGVEETREAGKRGAPPKVNREGKTLEKIVRYVLAAGVVAPSVGEEDAPTPTLAEQGWVTGTEVSLKGSIKVAVVVGVREDYLAIQYPGSKWIDTVKPAQIQVVK